MNDASTSIAALCTDDGSIDQTLAEVEEKLSLWLEAVTAAQVVLASQAEAAAPSIVTTAPPMVATEAPADTTEEPAHVAEPPATEAFEAEAQEQAEEPAQLVELPPEAIEPLEPPVEQEEDEDDEQEFLASLDEDTRMRIRVLRRMGCHHKTVRELYEDVQAEQLKTELRRMGGRTKGARWWRSNR